ncbi:3-deoxy-manno-octulosonate cytidylyltransferase [Litchfieldella xinjiangensis]|uniref:3-deoxy-manno-octulosonate cytidylyltransferase n=1 Tax=Litchfieldella xinjiangensis TaxID=1166948 RepID=UPI0005B84CEC|nr:3-deoxy-manno-octulosonate cytidylyltransferase [Halomonas xinjiangensis]
MSEFIAVIPARYASTRLPGKPLQDICGEPMVVKVWRQALQSRARRVVVATDDARIQEAVEAVGGEALLTAAEHPTGTDRLAEVAETLGLAGDEIIVNVQGDEPLLPSTLIDQVAGCLADDTLASIGTLAETIDTADALFDANVVKVVRDGQGRALYFSRAPIPWDRDAWREHSPRRGQDSPEWPVSATDTPWLRHIGLYAYRVSFLNAYRGWAPSPLEKIEQLEQLRALHHGHRIQVALATERHPAGVDTASDLERVRRLVERQLGKE